MSAIKRILWSVLLSNHSQNYNISDINDEMSDDLAYDEDVNEKHSKFKTEASRPNETTESANEISSEPAQKFETVDTVKVCPY